jgi:UDP-N-acetyl-2-amino-2-deoxyglucuronate dehydrogenase
MRKFNVGILGYGWAATAHIEAINATSTAHVTGICSKRDLDQDELSKTHGSPIRAYKSQASMFEDPEIDIISITGYPKDHARHVIAAAAAGKHLIIEKPIALSLDECIQMKRAVDEAQVQTCVCFELRYSSQFIATKSLLDQGMIGSVHYAEIDYYHGIGPWYGQFRWNTTKENGGSSLLSAGCHALDALLLCMGSEVESVYTSTTKSNSEVFNQYEYPTSSVSVVNFKNGAVGKVASVIDCQQPYYFRTHLVGSEGSLLDNKIFTTKVPGLKKEWSKLSFDLCDSGDVSDHPYQTQFEAFFESLSIGKEMPLTSLSCALKTFEVLFAAEKSATERRPIKIANQDE